MATLYRRFLFAAVSLLVLSACAKAQNLFFQPLTYTGVGQTVTADFNGDGKPDLLSSDGTVQLGNGDGSFKAGTPWTSGQNITGVTSIAAADFNGDGKTDLAVTAGTFLYILLGNGDGTFQTALSANIGTNLSPILVADVNSDGKPDLLGIGSAKTFVLLGKGDGTFSVGSPFPFYGLIGIGDFNGDGKLDIVLANGGSANGTLSTPGPISVLLGNGDGTFQSPLNSTGVVSPVGIAVGDFNGDGHLDLALADDSGLTFILLGNGNGTFQLPGSSLPGAGGLTAIDLNGDHKLDLVIESFPFVQIFLGDGNGSFTQKDGYLENTVTSSSVLIADFNGDSKADVAAGNVVLLGNGDGSFNGNFALSLGPVGATLRPQHFPVAGAAGDFNHDGNPDVALIVVDTTDNTTTTDVDILLGDGAGNLALDHTYTLSRGDSSIPAIATADLNGDGKLDLIVLTFDPITTGWSLNVLLGNGDGSFGAPLTFPQGGPTCCTDTGSLLSLLAIADLNGDHKPDVVVLNQISGDLNVFIGNGDGTFSGPAVYFAGSQPNSFVLADVNNDGILDFVVDSSAGLGVLLGKGDGTFQPATFTTTSAILELLGAADLNGDGNVDLVVRNDQSSLDVVLGSGNGTFTALPSGNLLTDGTTPIFLVDLNGDGKLDVVQVLPSSAPGLAAIVQALLGNGDGTFANPITILQPAAARFALVADFNHDNRPDVAVTVSGGDETDKIFWGLTTVLNTAPSPVPDFLLSTSPVSPVSVGNETTSTVTLTSIGEFTGSVALSCTGLPSGVNCGFAPSSVSGTGSSALTISTGPSTTVGRYLIDIVGSSGSLTYNLVVALVVTTSTGGANASLQPASLTFAPEATGTNGSPQTVQLTNTGTTALTISTITITGANAGDFSQTNTCTSTSPFATGASCQISVTFTPTGIGSRAASLFVSDNATGSPQMVTLSGTGPDFSMSAGSTQTEAVKPGATATYTITVAPAAGFNQTVALTCTGEPLLTACTISPPSLQLNGASSAMATVTIKTTAPTPGQLLPFGREGHYIDRHVLPFPLALLGVFLTVILLARKHHTRFPWATPIAFTALLWLATTLSSCGGGSSSGSGGPSSSPGTTAGTYMLTISGSSGSGSVTTHTTTLTLIVQ